MNELRLPEQPTPPPSPLPPASHVSRESLWKGVAIAWAVNLGGGMFALQVMNMATGFLLFPLLTAVAAIVLVVAGRRRLGIGLLLGLLSIAAVVLLLVAACFGLVSAFR